MMMIAGAMSSSVMCCYSMVNWQGFGDIDLLGKLASGWCDGCKQQVRQ